MLSLDIPTPAERNDAHNAVKKLLRESPPQTFVADSYTKGWPEYLILEYREAIQKALRDKDHFEWGERIYRLTSLDFSGIDRYLIDEYEMVFNLNDKLK